MKAIVFILLIQGTFSHPQLTDSNTRIEVDPSTGGEVIITQKPIDLVVSMPGSVGVANGAVINANGAITGLDCGSTTQMNAGNTAKIFSTNFGLANYRNNEACSWKFQANKCSLSAYCPCVDIPKSWECLGDYLKISSEYLQNERFCGSNNPGTRIIRSETDFLSVRFRSNGKTTGKGFSCSIRCEAPGQPIAPDTTIMCPAANNGMQG